MQPGTLFAEKLPAEVWQVIFEHVPKSGDLHSMSVASWKFRNLTTRALHRDVVWEKERPAAQNLDRWKTERNMASRVQSLVLGIGGVPSDNTAEENAAILDKHTGSPMIEEYISGTRQADLDYGHLFPFTLQQVQLVLWARAQTFTNLSFLVLKNMTIGNGHFRFMHRLARLRSLRLIDCSVDRTAADGFDNRALPITELVLIGVRRGPGAVPDHPLIVPIQRRQIQVQPVMVHMPLLMLLHRLVQQPLIHDPFAQALTLAIATNLTTLTVNLSVDVFRHVFSAPGAQARGWTIPVTLEHLYILQERTITACHPNHRDDEDEYVNDSIYWFCSWARNLKTVSTPFFAPQKLTLDPYTLPPRLEAFAAPFYTAYRVVAYREVKALGVLRADTRQAIHAITLIARVRPALEVLVFEVKTWDVEIVYAIAHHLKKLRRMKIVYGKGGPDEVQCIDLSLHVWSC